MKKVQKVLLLASVMSAFTNQVIFASEVASSEIASSGITREIVPTDNERERERERESNSRTIPTKSWQVDSSDSIKSKKSDSAIYDSKAQDFSAKNATSQDLRAKDLGKVVAKGYKDNGAQSRERYQSSAGEISRRVLESSPSGNGDIGSILRILPNVQYDITQLRSTTPGEIDPAKISISGGLHYQNSFQLDGMNMNNDINPMGSTGYYGGAKGHTQGLNIDTSLLESIIVQDSNISASYGGFSGGVVEANTRKPSKKFGASISYQFTQGDANPANVSLTTYHLNEQTGLLNFINSSSQSNQPIFTKHLIRASLESKINDRFGILASFSSTLSFIPLWYNSLSYLQAGNIQPKKQNQNRQSYNYFFKSYYDFTPNVRTEFTYSYAPQNNTYFISGTKDNFYTSVLGGHQVGLKTMWDNTLGTLTHTLSYSYLENSTQTKGYTNHQFWYMSEAKNWDYTWGSVRQGGHAPYDSTQHTISNKILQDFTPFEMLKTTHRFSVGAEIAYQYVQNQNPRLYYASSHTPRPMNQQMQASCLATDLEWCDPTKTTYVYTSAARKYAEPDTSKGETQYDSYRVSSLNDFGISDGSTKVNGYDTQIWQYGQWVTGSRALLKGGVSLDNVLGAVFAEDDIGIGLGKLGRLSARLGVRLDADSYMGKATFAPRFSATYQAPHNALQKYHHFASQITFGANRYYGRNIFAYALADGMNTLLKYITRSGPNKSFDDILAHHLATGEVCNPNEADYSYDCVYQVGQNTTKFSQLKVPYSDELMIGMAQKIYDFTLGVKYIYRIGKDEVRRSTRALSGLPLDSAYQSNYYIYTNEGKSKTNVLTISFQNDKPIILGGIQNFVLFAYDYTNVVRNYTDYTDTLSNLELANQWISWGGKIIRYGDKPAENFVRPYTIRLNTTSAFVIGRFKWLWNNFLRYRSSYNAMAAIPASYGGNTRRAQPDKVNGVYVDTFRPFLVKGAFSWDMRLGFEVDIWRGKRINNTLQVNIDIYNVLNNKNMAIASASGVVGSVAASAVPVYEVGRQFWLEVGYKF
ncbi:Plug domain-containing protein [Helicobacter sp. MIT 01-3238]|uniref:Plug domain-containing protein n=1 Tax=Helicobacter sp. MIT 01-3238 TaxID=398627 RepID=UPI0015F13628|nr:Plug domain-containing protein [Helicobacter sp. MIT 01-3238]